MHEAFNIGLDPSLGLDAGQGDSKGGEGLVHSDNLWPEEDTWKGAKRFVSSVKRKTHVADTAETGKPRLLVRHLDPRKTSYSPQYRPLEAGTITLPALRPGFGSTRRFLRQ